MSSTVSTSYSPQPATSWFKLISPIFPEKGNLHKPALIFNYLNFYYLKCIISSEIECKKTLVKAMNIPTIVRRIMSIVGPNSRLPPR